MIFQRPRGECDPRDLEQLLRDELPEAEKAAVIDHLDGCRDCQQQIERLAASSRWWHDVRALDEPADETREAGVPADDLWLTFLDPPASEGHIGRLGPYEVVEVLGRGGMGLVLKAHDPALNRFVAIKVLAPHLSGTAAARRRFAREAKAVAAVSHERVVAIYSVDSAGRLPCIVMEYVAGKSLQQRIDQAGPLEITDLLRIAMQAASGLAAAHAQGLIHRDIKPSNILLESDVERVKLTDFGLALAVDDASLTQSGLVAGTPQYMAPEQARGEPVDHRADLFSLGSVLYAMACGWPPFRAASTIATLRRVSDESPRPVREVNPDVPEWLAAIVGRLHAREPADRFQSAGELAELLGRWLAHIQNPRNVPRPEPVAVTTGRGPTRRRYAFAAGAIAVACVIILGGASGVPQHLVAKLATVLIKTADGVVAIEVDDPSINVQIDGDEVVLNGVGFKELRVAPGRHTVKADRGGQSILEKTVTVERGGQQLVRITREGPAAGPTANTPGTESAADAPEVPSVTAGPLERAATPIDPLTPGARTQRRVSVPTRNVSDAVDELVARLRKSPARPSAIEKKRFGLFLTDVVHGGTTQIAGEPLRGFNFCGSPSWSSDGSRLIFDVAPGGEFPQGRLVMFAPGGLKDLGSGNCPSFSPDGQQIAFLLNAPGESGIWTMRADGTERCRLGEYGRPKWSPDGRRMMITSFSNPCGVSLIDSAGTVQSIEGLSITAVPNWIRADTFVAAIDGDTIATFGIEDPQRPALAPPDGRNLFARVTFNLKGPQRPALGKVLWRKSSDLDPAPLFPVYSPTARRCVFIGSGPQGMALYCIDQDRPGRARRLEPTRFDRAIQGLALSPDGRYAVFASDRPARPPGGDSDQ
jgi:hypothetical protein